MTSKGEMLRSKPIWARGREPREKMPRGFFQKLSWGGYVKGDTKGIFQKGRLAFHGEAKVGIVVICLRN